MSNMYEIFMPIKGYEDTYAVSNLGRVKNIKTDKILKPYKLNTGYMCVALFKNKKRKQYFVHRLVISAFKTNPQNKPEVNHIDENKENNCVNNLEWMTRKENVNHGTRSERATATLKTNGIYEKMGKINSERQSIPVYCITTDTVYKSAQEAAKKLNLDRSRITKCCKGKRKSTGGYQFKYYTEGDLL